MRDEIKVGDRVQVVNPMEDYEEDEGFEFTVTMVDEDEAVWCAIYSPAGNRFFHESELKVVVPLDDALKEAARLLGLPIDTRDDLRNYLTEQYHECERTGNVLILDQDELGELLGIDR